MIDSPQFARLAEKDERVVHPPAHPLQLVQHIPQHGADGRHGSRAARWLSKERRSSLLCARHDMHKRLRGKQGKRKTRWRRALSTSGHIPLTPAAASSTFPKATVLGRGD